MDLNFYYLQTHKLLAVGLFKILLQFHLGSLRVSCARSTPISKVHKVEKQHPLLIFAFNLR